MRARRFVVAAIDKAAAVDEPANPHLKAMADNITRYEGADIPSWLVLDMVAAAFEAEVRSAGDGWLPIETAPKNIGILGYWMLDKKRGHIDRIWWDSEFEQSGWDEQEDEPIYRGAWTAGRVSSWGAEEYAEERPTHWCPLPTLPPRKSPMQNESVEDRVAVTQEDRDAAADYVNSQATISAGSYLRNGEDDEHPLVQAFARHRLTAWNGRDGGVEQLAPQEAWQELVEYDDRTSPEDYPDMALITFDELKAFMDRATPTVLHAPTVDALKLARPIVEVDWHAAREAGDADQEGMSWTALEAIDAALRALPVAGVGELTADFVRALPGGVMDDSTFEEIETALDRADAPSEVAGKWLTLPERIAALSHPGPDLGECREVLDSALRALDAESTPIIRRLSRIQIRALLVKLREAGK